MAIHQSLHTGDGRLDILVLGSMGAPKDYAASMNVIGDALRVLLQRPRFAELLRANHVQADAYAIHLPSEWDEQEIIKGILSHLDIADLVIVNLTPKEGPEGEASPNVYYELGLVHSLGLPTILLHQEGTRIPFYMLTNKGYRVKSFTVGEVAECLSGPLEKFLNPADTTDFTDNRITQFYEGLPVIDISAAIGLATGYYYNFVGRLLREGSFVTAYPDKVRHLVIVRPENIMHSYEEDHLLLEKTLTQAGMTLQKEQLPQPPHDLRGPCWIEHVDGIVLDLQRMVYPLKISPRLLALQERLDKLNGGNIGQAMRDELLRRTGDKLLDRVRQAILYHVRKEREGYRRHLLHFCAIAEVPSLINSLQGR